MSKIQCYAAIIATFSAVSSLMMPVHAQEIVYRLAHDNPETTVKGQTAKKFAELVLEHTGGQVEIQVFPGAQLVPTLEELRAVSRGQVDIVAPYSSYFSAIDPAWDFFYQPALFDSSEQAIEVFSGPVGRSILNRVQESGLVGLSIWHDGPVYLFTKDREVKIPADMAGLKIRAAPSNPHESFIENASATPVAMPSPEAYLALQQGVATAAVTTPTFAGPAGWHEVLKYGTRMMWGMGGYGLVMNAQSLEKLSEPQREGFMRAVEETAIWSQERALESITHWENKLEELGIVWYSPNSEELAQWRAAGSEIWESQPDMIRDYINQTTE